MSILWRVVRAISVALALGVVSLCSVTGTALAQEDNGGEPLYLPWLAYSPLGDMVEIPAGEFQMGCDSTNDSGCLDNELPLHTVHLDKYFIDRLEVTNSRYKACVDSGACTAPRSVNSVMRAPYYGNPDFANYPVIFVDWHQAKAFCTWEGKRLPSEAEWEKAARGDTDTRIYPWGDSAPGCNRANFKTECLGDTAEVGSYPAGASLYQVMDMSGNVSEWVNDWYDESYYATSPSSNPRGPSTGELRVLRGGGWHFGLEFVRVANRFREYPDSTDPSPATGFRCARTR